MSNKEMPFPEVLSDNGLIFKELVTKTKLKEFAETIITSAKEGQIDALDRYIAAKIGLEYLNTIIKGISSLAIDEAAKYEKEEAKMYGCGFAVSNVPDKYSFDHDDTWNDLKAKMDDIKKQLDEAGYDNAVAVATQAEVDAGAACGQLSIITED